MLKSKAWCSLSLSYLKSKLGSGSFFSENKSLSSALLTNSLGSASFTSLVYT